MRPGCPRRFRRWCGVIWRAACGPRNGAIERLTRQARKLIAQDPQLAERFELLDSVPESVKPAPCNSWGSWACWRPVWRLASG